MNRYKVLLVVFSVALLTLFVTDVVAGADQCWYYGYYCEVSVDPVGEVLPAARTVTVHGIVTCVTYNNPHLLPVWADQNIEVTQKVGQKSLYGEVTVPRTNCRGGSPWSGTVTDINGDRFVGGWAQVTVNSFITFPDGTGAELEPTTATVQLRGTRP